MLSLTETKIAVKTSLLVYIAFSFVIGIGGLIESYFFFASPAWTADYGIAFTGKETFFADDDVETPLSKAFFGSALTETQADRVLGNNRSGLVGLFIELVRLIIIGGVFYLLVGVALDNDIIGSVGIPAPFSSAWYRSPLTRALLILAVIVLLGLAYYHFHYAPKRLEHNPKYWFELKNSKRLWELVPSPHYGHTFWQEWIRDPELRELVSAKAIKNVHFSPPRRAILFYLPYAGYFLYSLAIFLLLSTPALVVSFRAIWHFTTNSYGLIGALRNETAQTIREKRWRIVQRLS
jgi:hypothetical protein